MSRGYAMEYIGSFLGKRGLEDFLGLEGGSHTVSESNAQDRRFLQGAP